MIKQPQVTEATRKKFIDTFCTLYAQKPIERITVKEIAEKSGYNRVTFYQYFKDVYDLLGCIEKEVTSSILSAIKKNVNETKDSRLFFLTFRQITYEKENLIKILLCNPYNAWRIAKDTISEFCDIFGVDESDVHTRYVFEFYVPGIIAMIGRWLENQDEISADELVKLVQEILGRGIYAQLPSKYKLKI